MNKQKDIEKIKAEKEHVEKIKPEKEHIKIEKIEKHEHKEYKEPIKEKVEHKEKPEKQEHKEKPEKHEHKDKIEIKEHAKIEKIENKEIAKLEQAEKLVPEKGGKEVAEGVDPGDIFTAQPHSLEAPQAAAARRKDVKKPAKEHDKLAKEIEKIQKEHDKFQKEIDKIKREKEFIKNEFKEHKNEKFEIKEKPEKFEKHEKQEKFEKEHVKLEIKELQNEVLKDFSTEGPGKLPIEGPGHPGDLVTNPFKGSGTPEDRLGELEDAVTRLSHFIGVDLRPDLSAGALNKEPDVAAAKDAKPDQPGGPAKPDDKGKKP